jgi:hypothetical protein
MKEGREEGRLGQGIVGRHKGRQGRKEGSGERKQGRKEGGGGRQWRKEGSGGREWRKKVKEAEERSERSGGKM